LTKQNLEKLEKMEAWKKKKKSAVKRSIEDASTTTGASKEGSPSQRRKTFKEGDSETTTSTRSKDTTVSTTAPGFPDLACRNGILEPDCSNPPENLESLQEQINRKRNSPSPTLSQFGDYTSAIANAVNEATIIAESHPVLLRNYKDRGYKKTWSTNLGAFPKNVGFNNGISPAQPDMMEGLSLTQFKPFPAREELGGAAVVYQGAKSITLAHLAAEWKGPGNDMVLAQAQAAYDGACLVYGRNIALSYLGTPDVPGHAHVSTFTTDGTNLHIFGHFVAVEQGRTEYHQYPIARCMLIASYDDYKKGRRQLRNLQDLAKENSEALRDELRKKWTESMGIFEVIPVVPVDPAPLNGDHVGAVAGKFNAFLDLTHYPIFRLRF
jgi:hypothetical protein